MANQSNDSLIRQTKENYGGSFNADLFRSVQTLCAVG